MMELADDRHRSRYPQSIHWSKEDLAVAVTAEWNTSQQPKVGSRVNESGYRSVTSLHASQMTVHYNFHFACNYIQESESERLTKTKPGHLVSLVEPTIIRYNTPMNTRISIYYRLLSSQ